MTMTISIARQTTVEVSRILKFLLTTVYYNQNIKYILIFLLYSMHVTWHGMHIMHACNTTIINISNRIESITTAQHTTQHSTHNQNLNVCTHVYYHFSFLKQILRHLHPLLNQHHHQLTLYDQDVLIPIHQFLFHMDQ
jgi:hypothetical protein